MNLATLTQRIVNNKRILTGLGFALLFLVTEALIHVVVLRRHDNVLDEIFA